MQEGITPLGCHKTFPIAQEMMVRILLSTLLPRSGVLLRAVLALGATGFFCIAQAQLASPTTLLSPSPGVIEVPAGIEIFNLRPYWLEQTLPAAHGLSPDALIALPAEQFVRNTGQIAANLDYNKTLLLRTQMQFEVVDKVWILEIPMARLDEVFIHYRYAKGAWHTAHMGDKVAYKEWPFPNQHPAVQLVGTGPTLDVLLEVRHAGRFTAPVWMKGDTEFRNDRLRFGALNGLIIGFMMAMALVCVASWRAFGIGAFNWVAVQLLMFAFAVTAYQGYGDLFLWKDASPWWRDQSKLISTMFLLAVMLPLFSSVLRLRKTDPFVWGASLTAGFLTLVTGCTMAAVLPAQLRVTGAAALSILILAAATWLCIAAVRRGERIAVWLCLCFGLYAFCIIATAVDNLIRIESVDVPHIAPLGYAFGTLFLIYGMYTNHRFGTSVHQQQGGDRFIDVLTGLPNRDGLDKEFAHQVLQLRAQRSSAVFLLVRLQDADRDAEDLGREKFEEGVVNLAAALVGCILPGETLARLDDITFAIVASEHKDSASADQLTAQVLARSMASHGPGDKVLARVVVLPIPSGGSLLEGVLHKCEQALIAAPFGKRIIKLHASGKPINSAI